MPQYIAHFDPFARRKLLLSIYNVRELGSEVNPSEKLSTKKLNQGRQCKGHYRSNYYHCSLTLLRARECKVGLCFRINPVQTNLSIGRYNSPSEMAEREEKIKKEVKTDDYGNVRKEEVSREVDTKSEAERDLQDVGDKMKAGAKAMGAKMEDPDRDMGAQYEKKKAEEKLKD
jgi:hypothetical protein